jgi:serine/threonine-protein kinase HipA
MRKGFVYFKNEFAGEIIESEEGFEFRYNEVYLNNEESIAISFTLPKKKEPYIQKNMFAFFDGLIPEGWMLDIALRNWKLNRNDRMSLLLDCCGDTIGAVSIKIKKENSKNEK